VCLIQAVPPAIGTAASSSNPPAPAPTLTVIEPVSFRGRTISSLRRPADCHRYILLDAVCRVFFPQQLNVSGFIRAIETLFHIPDVRMNEAEQQHFISFYKLPTDRLSHNKLIRLDLLSDIFPRLEMMFSAQVGVAEGQLIGTVISRPASDVTTTSHGHIAPTPAIDVCTSSTATNNNKNNDGDKANAKRRRKDIGGTDIVVIDWRLESIDSFDIKWHCVSSFTVTYTVGRVLSRSVTAVAGRKRRVELSFVLHTYTFCWSRLGSKLTYYTNYRYFCIVCKL